MNRQPKLMILLSVGYALVGLGFPIQVMFLNEYSLLDVGLIFSQMTVLNQVSMGLCFAIALGLFNCSSLTAVLLPVLTTAVLYNNYLVGLYEYQYSVHQALVASLMFITMTSIVYLVPFVRTPLFDSGKRWWKTPLRLKASFEANLYPFVGVSLSGATYDLSETGFFIADDGVKPRSKEMNFTGLKNDLRIGDRTGVLIKVSPAVSVKCEAIVVRKSNGVGKYPPGLGFQFEKLDGLHRKMIRHMIQVAATAA